jgi:hypothetical protein
MQIPETFLTKARSVHGDRYSYDSVEWINTTVNISITCYKHGMFNQRPSLHVKGHKCPECFREERQQRSYDIFVIQANAIHQQKYLYDGTTFQGRAIKMKIICPKHGPWKQAPTSHLKGNGCQKCKGEHFAALYKSNTATFITKAQRRHNNLYSYDRAHYIRSHAPITVTCQKHGDWQPSAGNHLKGSGCPKCSFEIRQFSYGSLKCTDTRTGTLYFIELRSETERFIKIGMTCVALKQRFRQMPYTVSNIHYSLKATLYQWYRIEQAIKLQFSHFSYRPHCPMGGATECFRLEAAWPIVEVLLNYEDTTE